MRPITEGASPLETEAMIQPNFESEQMTAIAEVVRHSVQQSVEQAIAPLSHKSGRLSDGQTEIGKVLKLLAEQQAGTKDTLSDALTKLAEQQVETRNTLNTLSAALTKLAEQQAETRNTLSAALTKLAEQQAETRNTLSAALTKLAEQQAETRNTLSAALTKLAVQQAETGAAVERLAERLENLEKSVHDLRIEMKEDFKAMEERWDKRITEMDARWDKRITEMDARWDKRITAMEERWDRRIVALEEYLRGNTRRIYYAISIMVLLVSAIVALANYLPKIF